MEEIFYTRDNHWVSIDNDILTIGLTDVILNEINIINFIELPAIGSMCSKTEIIGQINYDDDENINLSSIFTGKIIDINDSLLDNYEQLLSNDRDNSWIYRIGLVPKEELEEELMTEEEYEDYKEDLE